MAVPLLAISNIMVPEDPITTPLYIPLLLVLFAAIASGVVLQVVQV